MELAYVTGRRSPRLCRAPVERAVACVELFKSLTSVAAVQGSSQNLYTDEACTSICSLHADDTDDIVVKNEMSAVQLAFVLD